MMEALKNFRINNKVCLANEIYKMSEDQKSASGRNQVCSLASYLYIACRQEDKTRSIKSTKQFWFICIYSNSWQLELETGQSVEMGTIHAGDFMVSAFGFLFVVLTFLVGNGESGSRVCAEVKGVQYKKKPLRASDIHLKQTISDIELLAGVLVATGLAEEETLT
ncbi:hypothetical protein HID58_082111 [Brassica napus]|uniref:Transcription factor TFIIB cyclin-like domain-containing protein n=1 Tax=Brassica napus TaxID=3708 RepID=A0ABQ7YCR7_BRANA|nr:hypothetical protein HID58_082111 [Brassica napus]